MTALHGTAFKRLLLITVLMQMMGCSTVRTDAEGAPVVGMWFGADKAKHQIACDVLCDHGLRASVDERGVVIKQEEIEKAMNILLTDERMQESGLIVPVYAVAGTGRYTKDGLLECIVLAGNESPNEMDAEPKP